jgi:ribosomal protein S18 acetylase RimI-like enzyme
VYPAAIMIKAHRIKPENMAHLAPVYKRFAECAQPEYRWVFDPVDFDQFKLALANRILQGYWVEDTASPEPVGLMLYRLEEHRAIEINVIYSELEDKKTVLDRLMRLFISDVRDTEGWDVVSYAMLGKQEGFIRTVCWYGFKPVGQAILNFDIMDPISLQILKQQRLELPGPEYVLDAWKPEYAGGVAESIYEAFVKSTDALWDPRFRTLTGTRKVVGLITANMMGTFLPDCTTVVLRDGIPVGFCFLVQDSLMSGNIPLVGVRPSEKGKNLGNILLQACLNHCIDGMLAERNSILKVSTTMDTDNIPAIKMYRRIGFREEYNYPHVYLTREKAMAYTPGKWC